MGPQHMPLPMSFREGAQLVQFPYTLSSSSLASLRLTSLLEALSCLSFTSRHATGFQSSRTYKPRRAQKARHVVPG